MKLTIITHIAENVRVYIVETIETLEALAEVSSLKENELDVYR